MNQKEIYIDTELFEKANKVAQSKGMTLTDYIEYILVVYLNGEKEIKLVVIYDDGSRKEENLFCTQKEAAESMMVTEYMRSNHIKNLDGKEIISWELWRNGNLITSHPSVESQ